MVMIFCAPDFSNAPKIIPKNRKDYFYHKIMRVEKMG